MVGGRKYCLGLAILCSVSIRRGLTFCKLENDSHYHTLSVDRLGINSLLELSSSLLPDLERISASILLETRDQRSPGSLLELLLGSSSSLSARVRSRSLVSIDLTLSASGLDLSPLSESLRARPMLRRCSSSSHLEPRSLKRGDLRHGASLELSSLIGTIWKASN